MWPLEFNSLQVTSQMQNMGPFASMLPMRTMMPDDHGRSYGAARALCNTAGLPTRCLFTTPCLSTE